MSRVRVGRRAAFTGLCEGSYGCLRELQRNMIKNGQQIQVPSNQCLSWERDVWRQGGREGEALGKAMESLLLQLSHGPGVLQIGRLKVARGLKLRGGHECGRAARMKVEKQKVTK